MNYRRHFFNEKRRLEKEIKELEKKAARLPDGELHCYECNGYYYPYRIYPGRTKRRSFIKKDRYGLAEDLALKTFYQARINDCNNELAAVNAFLSAFGTDTPTADRLLENSLFRKLLMGKLEDYDISPGEKELIAWEKEPYAKYTGYPENLKFITTNGRRVRSKAEQEIAQLLYDNHIHYRYECEMIIKGKYVYPDFTIRHPVSGRIFIWEHFGMMDNPDYYAGFINKLSLYRQAGYTFGINLIITIETAENPMDINTIQAQIDRWLLE